MKKTLAAGLIVLLLLFALAVCGCAGNPGAWTITINGAGVINGTIYDDIANSNETINGTNGVPLEQFLYRYGIFPVTSVSIGDNAYNWTWLASATDMDMPVLVLHDGRIFDGQGYLRADNINVTVADKPAHSSLEIEASMLHALGLGGNGSLMPEKSNRIVLFYVDALGYERYEEAKSKGIINNITSLGEPQKISSVYPSISIVNSKTLVSGIPPDARKGNFRGYYPDGPTILDIAAQYGLTAYWIDGRTSPVSLGDHIINRPDTNSNGYEADEVASEAIDKYGNEVNLLFVHFKDTDSSMHAYGPYSGEAMAALQFVDAQIGRLLLMFDPGTIVIVYSDHGGHDVPHGGNHGTLIPDDMIVPFIVHVV